MTNSDEQAFMTAILAQPEDDTPRLVFADWLDERGQGDDAARAAIIRAQCRIEVLAPKTKERRKLEKEVESILAEHGESWTQALRESNLVQDWQFRRGFLHHVDMSATTFAQNAKKLFEIVPTLRSVWFVEAANEMARVAKCKYLGRLAAVDVREMCWCGSCPIHNDLRSLFSSKHTKSLTELNITGDRMGVAGMKQLANSTALAKLTALDVSDNPLEAAAITELGKSKNLKNLVTLNLMGTQSGGSGLEEIAKLTNLPALRKLNLAANSFSAKALKKFVASPLFAQLTSLDLMNTGIGDAGAKLLVAAPETVRLQTLDVRLCKITAKQKERLKKRFGKGVKC